jgi:hypothetical protein
VNEPLVWVGVHGATAGSGGRFEVRRSHLTNRGDRKETGRLIPPAPAVFGKCSLEEVTHTQHTHTDILTGRADGRMCVAVRRPVSANKY